MMRGATDMIGKTLAANDLRSGGALELNFSSPVLRPFVAAPPARPISPPPPHSPDSSIAPGASLSRLGRPLAALIDQAVVSGASFLTAVMVGRLAGEQQLGLYSLGFTLVVLACGIQESLVLIPYTVFAARAADEQRPQFAASALLQSVLVSLAMSLCLALGGMAATFGGGLPIGPVVAVLLVTVPMVLLREFGRRFAFAHMRLDAALAIDVSVAASQLALLGWLAWSERLSAVAALATLACCCGGVGLGWFWMGRRQFSLAKGRFVLDWRQNWSLGGWLLAGHVTGITQAYVLHWLLALILGPAATGEFAAAVTIVSLANPFILGAGNLLMPVTAHTFARSGAAGVWQLAVRSTRWLGAGLAVFSLLAALAGDWALRLVYGERFGGQALTVTLLALAISAAALGLAAEHGLRASDQPRAVFTANLSALVVTLLLAAWLVPSQRTTGAAASLLGGNLVGCFLRWWAFRFAGFGGSKTT
jgi:O-antigen/teichoic acid export membrane protein